MRRAKRKLDREKFTEFLAGVAAAAIWTACIMALLLKL